MTLLHKFRFMQCLQARLYQQFYNVGVGGRTEKCGQLCGHFVSLPRQLRWLGRLTRCLRFATLTQIPPSVELRKHRNR